MELKAEHYIGIFIRTRTPIKDGASFSLRISDKSRLVLRFGFRVVMVIRLRVVVMVRVKIKVRGRFGNKEGISAKMMLVLRIWTRVGIEVWMGIKEQAVTVRRDLYGKGLITTSFR